VRVTWSGTLVEHVLARCTLLFTRIENITPPLGQGPLAVLLLRSNTLHSRQLVLVHDRAEQALLHCHSPLFEYRTISRCSMASLFRSAMPQDPMCRPDSRFI
jgi:hypothetical protein